MKHKTVKIWYWIVTGLFAAFMVFSGVSELMQTEAQKGLLTALGYPVYLNYILGVAKLLGVFVILMPKFHVLKEWAYAGFTIDIVGASASMALAGLGAFSTIFTLLFLIPLFLSYWLWKKSYKN